MEKYNISFSGEIVPGQDQARVRERFAAAFHIDDAARLESIFSGKHVFLKRNLDREAASQYLASLRKIGVIAAAVKAKPDLKIIAPAPRPRKQPPAPEPAPGKPAQAPTSKPRRMSPAKLSGRINIRTAPRAKSAAPPPPAAAAAAPPAAAPTPRRKRQPGAPNTFELRLSERAGTGGEVKENGNYLSRAAMIASAIMLLACVLVGLRFWADSRMLPASGLGAIAIDPRLQPVVQIDDQLLLHDRAGVASKEIALSEFGVAAGAAFAFFGTGELLFLQREPPAATPTWLQPLLGAPVAEGANLKRCVMATRDCEVLAGGLGTVAFEIEQRTGNIYLADADADLLSKLGPDGASVASHAMELSAPLHLALQEGILYLTQADSDQVEVFKPDDRDFGTRLDSISLSVAGASQSGHIFPADIAWLSGYWWAIMQSRDGSAAGLYRFDDRWRFDTAVALPPGARPSALTRWGAKMLVSDPRGEQIYRLDADASLEKNFSSDSIEATLEQRLSEQSLSRSLQALTLLILCVAAAGLLALGLVQSLRGKLYTHPADGAERGIDIDNQAIIWLDPAPDREKHLRQLGQGIAAAAVLSMLVAFLAGLNVWALLGLCLLLAGLGAYYLALHKSAGGHLGLLDNNIILVDHTNTYRVGTGPNIQYSDNYIMIGDVIVYLGNPLFSAFAEEALQQKFQPVVRTGIKVDRATVRIKLLQTRHPMLLGGWALGLSTAAAVLLILFS